MTWAGSQTNGYSRWAIPSVDAEHAQPTWMIRQISQAIKLLGRRSTRAAISPGMTRVPPPAAAPAPEVSCAITVLHPVSGVAGKAGKGFALPVIGVDFAADAESAGALSARL